MDLKSFFYGNGPRGRMTLCAIPRVSLDTEGRLNTKV